ncbi:MAG TPA: hypothetical protein VK483_13035 [Chitinophagaceae bacterium]|nr:hypothetical protein [Chitinophagaceae bacterium]
MTTTQTVQDHLFLRIKEMLPQPVSLADAVSDILHVSSDSAYRRIRGETPLVLEEAALLCKHFNLSLDQLMALKPDDVLLRNVRIRNQDFTYRQYLQALQHQLSALTGFQQKEIIYMSKDIPIFHNFYFKPLIAFRYFFWMKTHLAHPDFEKLAFDFDLLPADIEKLSTDIIRIYCTIPSTEMWNTESINSTISQIEFSKDSGHFKSDADLKLVYDALESSIHHIKDQAEHGFKFMPEEDRSGRKQNLKFFFNRVVLGDNTVMAMANSIKTAFINYGHLNYLETRDEKFCNELYHDFENLIRRSTQISHSSERQRNVFFNILLAKVRDRKQNI